MCNPETGKWVKEDGKIGMKIRGIPPKSIVKKSAGRKKISQSICSETSKFAGQPGYICNPKTGRWVKEDGPTGRKVQGLPPKEVSSKKSKGKTSVKKVSKKKKGEEPLEELIIRDVNEFFDYIGGPGHGLPYKNKGNITIRGVTLEEPYVGQFFNANNVSFGHIWPFVVTRTYKTNGIVTRAEVKGAGPDHRRPYFVEDELVISKAKVPFWQLKSDLRRPKAEKRFIAWKSMYGSPK